MKNAHPGVHPAGDGSKWVKAKAADRRPAAALADKQMSITEGILSVFPSGKSVEHRPMTPSKVQQADRI